MSLKDANILSKNQLQNVLKKLEHPTVRPHYFSKNRLYVVKDVELQIFKKNFSLHRGTITMKLFEGNSRLNSQMQQLTV